MTVTPQIAALILLLVPGLLGHALFCAFTYTAKPSWSGRTVVALILSALSYLVLAGLRALTVNGVSLFGWLPDPSPLVNAVNSGVDEVLTANSLACVAVACVVSLALALGLVRAHNARLIHKLARFTGMTTKSGFESEWDSVMIQLARKRWIMVLMNDGSAFTGWLESHDVASDERAMVLSKVREYDSAGDHFAWPEAELLFMHKLDGVRAIRLIPVEEAPNAREAQGTEAVQADRQISEPKSQPTTEGAAASLADETNVASAEVQVGIHTLPGEHDDETRPHSPSTRHA